MDNIKITCPICGEHWYTYSDPRTETYSCDDCDAELIVSITETKITVETTITK